MRTLTHQDRARARPATRPTASPEARRWRLVVVAVLIAVSAACSGGSSSDDAAPGDDEAPDGADPDTAETTGPTLDPADDGLFVVGNESSAGVVENLGEGMGRDLVAKTAPRALIDLRHPDAIGAARLIAPGEGAREFVLVGGSVDSPADLVAISGNLDDPEDVVELAPIGASELDLYWDPETPGAIFGRDLTEPGLGTITFSTYECFRIDADSDQRQTLIEGLDCAFHPSGHAVAIEPVAEDQLRVVVSDLEGERTEMDLPTGMGITDFGLDGPGGLAWVTGELPSPEGFTLLAYDTTTGELVHQGDPGSWEVVGSASDGGLLVGGDLHSATPATVIQTIGPDGTVTQVGATLPSGVDVAAGWLAADMSRSLVVARTGVGDVATRLIASDATGTELGVLYEGEGASTGAPVDLWVVGEDPDSAAVALLTFDGEGEVVLVGGLDGPLVDVEVASDVELPRLEDLVGDPDTGDLLLTFGPGSGTELPATVLVPADGDPVVVAEPATLQSGAPAIIDLADGEAILGTFEDEASLFRIDGDGRTELGTLTDVVQPTIPRPVSLDREGSILFETRTGLFRCDRSGCDSPVQLPPVSLLWSQPPDRTAEWLVRGDCDLRVVAAVTC